MIYMGGPRKGRVFVTVQFCERCIGNFFMLPAYFSKCGENQLKGCSFSASVYLKFFEILAAAFFTG